MVIGLRTCSARRMRRCTARRQPVPAVAAALCSEPATLHSKDIFRFLPMEMYGRLHAAYFRGPMRAFLGSSWFSGGSSMKSGRFATKFLYSIIGALLLVGAGTSRALAQDDHSHMITAAH